MFISLISKKILNITYVSYHFIFTFRYKSPGLLEYIYRSPSVNIAPTDHIIDRHQYRTTDEAHKYHVQNTNSLLIKSCFLDGLDYYDIYCMIILAIIHPIKVSNLKKWTDTETWTMEITKRFNRDIGLTPEETKTHTLLVPIKTGQSYATGKRKCKPCMITAYPFDKELSDPHK